MGLAITSPSCAQACRRGAFHGLARLGVVMGRARLCPGRRGALRATHGEANNAGFPRMAASFAAEDAG